MTILDLELYKYLSKLRLGETRGEKIAEIVVTAIDELDDKERSVVIEHLYERYFTCHFEEGELE